PPLIQIRKFTVHAGIWGLFQTPKRVSTVRLEGLQIHMPPRQEKEKEPHDGERDKKRSSPVVIAEIIADGTLLKMLPRDAGKLPLEFQIHRLRLESVGIDRPMNFRAALRNPKPVGEIEATGRFGPWEADEPSDTPVSGDYTFQNANL